MQRTDVVLICDLCGRVEGDGVATHEGGFDGQVVQVEACEKCWAKVQRTLAPVAESGRRVKRKAPSARVAGGRATRTSSGG